MDEFLRRLRYYLRRRQFDAELEEEMAFHRAQSGARRFGNVTRLQEESREAWNWAALDGVARDLRYGVRQIRRSPGFASVAILSLASASAGTAIFGLLNEVRLRACRQRRPGLWCDPDSREQRRLASTAGGMLRSLWGNPRPPGGLRERLRLGAAVRHGSGRGHAALVRHVGERRLPRARCRPARAPAGGERRPAGLRYNAVIGHLPAARAGDAMPQSDRNSWSAAGLSPSSA
jgi:hypothetical protein